MAAAAAAFVDWDGDYNPFDAIGFPSVGLNPPSPEAFSKAAQYAMFATDTDRQREPDAVAVRLPYSRGQVEKALCFLTGTDAPPEMVAGPDVVTWQWAYDEIIRRQCASQYRRTWAPERRRWETMVLDPPEIVNLCPTTPPLPLPPPPPPQGADAAAADATGSSPSTASTGPRRAECDARDGSVEPARRAREEVGPGGSGSLARDMIACGSLGIPRDSSALLELVRTLSQASAGDKASRSTGANAIRAQPLPAGSFKPGEKIFVGFHGQQLDLVAKIDMQGKDYRQAIFASIDATGHMHIRLRVTNMRGEQVPLEFRLRGVSSVPHKDIVYRDGLSGLRYDRIRDEVARQSLIPADKRLMSLQDAQPPAQGRGRRGQRGRPPERRSRRSIYATRGLHIT